MSKFIKSLGNHVNFIGNDGKEYTLHPLSLVEWGLFIKWVQFKPYREARAAELPKDMCDEIYEKCSTGKVKEETEEGVFEEFPITIGSTVVRESLFSLEGVGKFIELSLWTAHPELKYQPIGHILDFKKVTEIQEDVMILNGLIDKEVEDEEGNL